MGNGRILEVQHNFQSNVLLVYDLMNFDETILNFGIDSLKDLISRQKKFNITNPLATAESTLRNFENIRQNGSLRPKYNEIFNQCVVLLVSYFSSAIGDIFKVALTQKINQGMDDNLAKEEIKVTLAELQNCSSEMLGELVVLKKEISFQDMQSIRRVFQTYLDIDIEKDQNVNNIITGQACRHVIVHSGAIIDKRLIKQISQATPRDIKPEIKTGEKIQFDPEEIKIVGESMKRYINGVIEKLDQICIY
ncbi:MAG TPA: hypothetical protein PKA10_13935 [Selenomonadales bacterium]|nr:hypothetical protein [Selenomonadales bacterium]